MDTTQQIDYRGYILNDPEVQIVPGSQIGAGITGCVVDSVDPTDVDIVQFLEKRSLQDGMDAGDVYKGARRIRMAGTLYAATRALLFDAKQQLSAALDPILAQREEPGDKGYRPLRFIEPTNDAENWPDGTKPLQYLALPRSLSYIIDRDRMGGSDGNGLALPWQAVFICRDPSKTAQEPVISYFTPTVNASGTLTSRGDYLSPLNMLFQVTSAAGTITVTAGGSTFVLTIPASTGTRIVRVKGFDKLVTIEESNTEAVSQNIITFSGLDTWPMIPGGDSPYSVVFSGGITLTGVDVSRLWFYESFA